MTDAEKWEDTPRWLQWLGRPAYRRKVLRYDFICPFYEWEYRP